MSKPTVAMSKAKKIARSLLRENRRGRTWRDISNEDYGGKIHYVTLHKFAHQDGKYIPGDVEVRRLLGLLTERSPYGIMPRWWERTPEALAAFLHIRGNAKQLAEDTRKGQYAHRGRK